MTGLKLFTSNRLEILAGILSKKLNNTSGNPLTPDLIMVQSTGMQKWLSLEQAKKMGIWSNFKFFLPNTFIHEFFKIFNQELKNARYFDVDMMTWRIFNTVSDYKEAKGFEEIKIYLSDDNDIKKLQFSSRLANLYDQYLTFRPDDILDWDLGENNHWQAQLWRTITKEIINLHPPALRKKFFDQVKKIKDNETVNIPESISVFGISYLPRFHMEIISALSTLTSINMFIMNPSKEFWTDIKSDHDISKIIQKQHKKPVSPESLHYDKGNSLLASMGKLGKEFFDYLLSNDIEISEHYNEPGKSNVLNIIQNDIFNLKDRSTQDQKKNYVHDKSITINSCHSPMREVEVLFDFLIDQFNNNSNLEPNDIIVMTPDINLYAPYIHSVFSSPEKKEYYMPFSIADQNYKKENSIVNAFFTIIDLAESRLEATAILNILEYDDISCNFLLSANELELISAWIKETGICWGYNGNDRKNRQLPDFSENSWETGLNRLLLGYAMSNENQQFFMNILPYDKNEGNQPVTLGKFLKFFNLLMDTVLILKNKHTLNEWKDILLELLDTYFEINGDNETSIHKLRHNINRLDKIQTESGYDKKMNINVIKWFLERTLNMESRSGVFLSAGITFCTLLPMRSIPFKIICMIGMNNATFPRVEKTTGFDLIVQNPRAGDRSLRDEDRYLFLESILSAREKFYVSYIGQSIDDNSTIPPSILVSELIDYIDQNFNYSGKDISDLIINQHKIQGFSRSYFQNDSNLYSYSEENYKAYIAALDKKSDSKLFIYKRLPEVTPHNNVIIIKDLLSFINNPAKFLLTKRLGLKLNDDYDIINDREPFYVNNLIKYNLKHELLHLYLKNEPLEKQYAILKSKGILPHGNIGLNIFNNMKHEVENYGEILKQHMNDGELEPVEIDIKIEGNTVTGKIDNIYQRGLINYRCSKIRGKDRLKIWVLHNLLNCSGNLTNSKSSLLICTDETFEMENIDESKTIIKNIIDLYIKGNNELVPLFPESSFVFMKEFVKKGSVEAALIKSKNKWLGSNYIYGECEDPYFNLSFGNHDIFNNSRFKENFVKISIKVYEPMINFQKKIKHEKV